MSEKAKAHFTCLSLSLVLFRGTTFMPPPKETISMVPLPESKTKYIETVPHPTKVTILGDISKALTVIVTYHDVGLNHRWYDNVLLILIFDMLRCHF
jgi:hypothetical protein